MNPDAPPPHDEAMPQDATSARNATARPRDPADGGDEPVAADGGGEPGDSDDEPVAGSAAAPLSPDDLEQFQRDGYVLLERAFPRAAADACRAALWRKLEADHGIAESDPVTWARAPKGRVGIAESYRGDDLGAPWADCWSPRLRAAVDQLCGAAAARGLRQGRGGVAASRRCRGGSRDHRGGVALVSRRRRGAIAAASRGHRGGVARPSRRRRGAIAAGSRRRRGPEKRPRTVGIGPPSRRRRVPRAGAGRWESDPGPGCGWWVVSFPGIAEGPWGAEGSWHVDGHGYAHRADSREIGCLPIFLFSDVAEDGGGTALAPGSHRTVAELLVRAGDDGVDGSRSGVLFQ